jgi:hypothetical protein
MPEYGALTEALRSSSGREDWKHNIKKSIFLTPEGDRSFSEQFNTHKDVVIPGLEPDKDFTSGALRDKAGGSFRTSTRPTILIRACV